MLESLQLINLIVVDCIILLEEIRGYCIITFMILYQHRKFGFPLIMNGCIHFSPYVTPLHYTDVSPEEVNNYTAIFYLHGNSTPTIFKTGLLTRKLVFPKANRIVLFPAYVQHAHYLPVKESRMVINFNFSSLPLDAKMYGDVMNMGGHLK
jgi:hypothetical protein